MITDIGPDGDSWRSISVTDYDFAVRNHTLPQYERIRLKLAGSGEDSWFHRYTFRSLQPDQIRLLRIYPLKDGLQTIDGELPCVELVEVFLDAAPDYKAVSYAWGDLSKSSPLIIQEKGAAAACLFVTDSLLDVISILGNDSTEADYFWVDQLCINQYDLDERGRQVRLMSRIFQEAKRTIACLGKGDESTDLAFDLIEEISRSEFRYCSLEANVADINNFTKRFIDSPEFKSEDYSSGWEALVRLCERAWFTRLWTLQEIVVSKDLVIICGGRRCRHESLVPALIMARAMTGTEFPAVASTLFSFAAHASSTLGATIPLHKLLQFSSSCYKCSHPLDRVYALLSLQDQKNPCTIDIDYSRSVRALYSETVKAIIANTKSLDVLQSTALPGGAGQDDLPSWTADWSSQVYITPIECRKRPFNCSLGRNALLDECSEECLLTRGKVFASVTRTWTHKFPESEYFARLENHGENHAAMMGIDLLVPRIASALDDAGCFLKDMQSEQLNAYRNRLIAATLTVGNLREPADLLPVEVSTTDRAGLEGRLTQAILASLVNDTNVMDMFMHKRIGWLDSTKHPLAIFPNWTEPGDLVCILNGGKLPLVLRKAGGGGGGGGGGGDYRLVGECYVHGIMYGEEVTWAKGDEDVFRLV